MDVLKSQTTQKIYEKKTFWIYMMVYIGYIVLFIDRAAISIALPFIGQAFHLSLTELGVVSSAFFFSYALMQIPGGMISDRIGTKKTIVIAVTLWSVFTFATGLAGSLSSLLIIRVLFGIGEGAFPTAGIKQASELYPKKSSTATSVMISSNYVGSAIAPMIIAPIILAFGWQQAFHFLGIVGLIFVLVYFLVACPLKSHQQSNAAGKAVINTKAVLTNPITWQLFCIIFGLSMVTKGLDSWMPMYLLTTRHISLTGVAWMVPLPSIAAGIGAVLSGWLMQKFFTGREKWFLAGFSLLATIFMYGMYQSVRINDVIIFEVLTYFFKSLAFSGGFAYFARIGIKSGYATSIGIINFGGQLAGFVAPILIGFAVEKSGGSFSAAFMMLVMSIAIAFLASLTLKSGQK